jgi:hypothetical protein
LIKPSINVNINLKVDNVKQLMAALDALEHREVLVGFPADEPDRNPDPNGSTFQPTNALIAYVQNQGSAARNIAYVQNQGSAARNIPAREFMESGTLSVAPAMVDKLEQVGQKALEGDVRSVEKGLMQVGLIAEAGIKNRIDSNISPPLTQSSLAKRRRRGRSGTNTLVDTGQLRNAVTAVVRTKEPR